MNLIKKMRPAIYAMALTLAFAPIAGAQQAATAAGAAKTAVASETATAPDNRIEIDAVKKLMDAKQSLVVLDVRNLSPGAIIVKGALNVTYDKIEEWAKDKAKDTVIITYCACGSEGSSLAAVAKFHKLGFTNVHALKGGIQGWQSASLPIEEFKVQ